MRGHLTEKTDVFAFGVVALEIVSGRPNSDPSLEEYKMYLLEWVRTLSNPLLILAPPSFMKAFRFLILSMFIETILLALSTALSQLSSLSFCFSGLELA